MKRWVYQGMIQANLWVGGTGIVYGVMRYFMESSDPYAVANHPWQPHLQHLHILTAPALVFFFGVFWIAHAMPYKNSNEQEGRKTGLSMIYLAFPMILSGYLLQVSAEEIWRNLWIVLHISTSLLWITAFLLHWIIHVRLRGKRRKIIP